ncbi:MAG TPA: nucleoside-diphosphate sugar epimerase/dehydratase [Bryobacteraceae bacterium]|nr:nucleoside-diphosphate sugar epimerase/dehydratase [Bryobacteraceae bacterium]
MRLSLQRASIANRVAYLGATVLSMIAAFALRFDFRIPSDEIVHLERAVLVAVIAKVSIFHFERLHRTWRRFTGPGDLAHILLANLLASAVTAIGIILYAGREFPRSIYAIDFVLCAFVTASLSYMALIRLPVWKPRGPKPGRKRILIYGAGSAGNMLLREVQANRALEYEVEGFLDDDPLKKGCSMLGVRVLGSGRDAIHIVEGLKRRGIELQEIIVSFTAASGQQMREALANCRAAGVTCRTVPGIGELLESKVLSAQIRNFSVNDLLGRQPVNLNEEKVRSSIAGRSVLVTGAGGSIGSELCRQIARFEPRQLVAFDQAESDLFRIDSQLREKFPALSVSPELGDIRDYTRLQEVMERHGIDSIYHAAAYKHVPLLETHVVEAVRNNVLGTWNLLHVAREHQVANFLMISSDKAVNPTSLMGASKRVCEMLVSAAPPAGNAWPTRTVSVRFGNVLGSNGSVVPIFQTQIATGGPVKVTHPDMQRYFMTIPEAVMLVLQASTMGQGGEIFVLDMGEPVKIVDLARNMIRLAGLREGDDIEIQFTGLRPGEKLFEELNLKDERILPTFHPKIKVFQDPPVRWETMQRAVREMESLAAERNAEQLLLRITDLVAEYAPAAAKRLRKACAIA